MIHFDLHNVRTAVVFCQHHNCEVEYRPDMDAVGIFDLTHFNCPGLAREMARLPEHVMLTLVDAATDECRESWEVVIDYMSSAQELLKRTMIRDLLEAERHTEE